MSLIGWLHERYVRNRRADILARRIAEVLPRDARVLDVGCGDGLIDRLISRIRPDVAISGIDVLVREKTQIDVVPFDGKRIPYGDKSFDAVIFVDVLHHSVDPTALLSEAKRVANDVVILKDHIQHGYVDRAVLRMMDFVGNAHHGVNLPYDYWTEKQWREVLSLLGFRIGRWETRIGLYPWPFTYVFDRSMHFVAVIEPGR